MAFGGPKSVAGMGRPAARSLGDARQLREGALAQVVSALDRPRKPFGRDDPEAVARARAQLAEAEARAEAEAEVEPRRREDSSTSSEAARETERRFRGRDRSCACSAIGGVALDSRTLNGRSLLVPNLLADRLDRLLQR
jgi:hypothetical protein